MDASIDEQSEEFETFGSDRRHSIILRTKLSVRVHACIEKLYNSKGRDLRRALFSLKQIFQDDEELVHEFVKRDGLTCLVKVKYTKELLQGVTIRSPKMVPTSSPIGVPIRSYAPRPAGQSGVIIIKVMKFSPIKNINNFRLLIFKLRLNWGVIK